MELTATTRTASHVPTVTQGAAAQPFTSTRGLPSDHDFREVPRGWVARNGWSTNPWDGLLVTQQRPDSAALGQVRMWFPMYYGASTNANVGVGELVRELPRGTSEADALRAARELSAGDAPAIAVVREAGVTALRVAMTADVTGPYASTTPPTWTSFELDGSGTDHIDGPGTAAIARFDNDALRAIVDGDDSFVNPAHS